MTKNVLCLSLSNFFSVLTHLSLKDVSTCHTLQLCYPNEELSNVQHDFKQLDLMRLSYYYRKGLIPSMSPYSLDAHLSSRIEYALKTLSPSLVFMEYDVLQQRDYDVLACINRLYDGPVILFSQQDKSRHSMHDLLRHGVNELSHSYSKDTIRELFFRHTNHKTLEP